MGFHRVTERETGHVRKGEAGGGGAGALRAMAIICINGEGKKEQ